MDKNIGQTIKSLRTSKNLSQKALGLELGYSPRTISDWEYGNTEPNITAIRAIVKYFGISYNDLFEEI